jgi:hypothetical protein
LQKLNGNEQLGSTLDENLPSPVSKCNQQAILGYYLAAAAQWLSHRARGAFTTKYTQITYFAFQLKPGD